MRPCSGNSDAAISVTSSSMMISHPLPSESASAIIASGISLFAIFVSIVISPPIVIIVSLVSNTVLSTV